MAASPQPPLAKAAAFRLIGHLDTYEEHLRVLVEAWPDAGTQAWVTNQVDLMGSEAMALPELMVPWMEFLMSHHQLLHAVARAGSTSERLDALEPHIGLLLVLQDKCLQLIAGHPPPADPAH